MSEPVTHAEIEDVLSSIRRLVSETGREQAGAAPVQAPKPSHTRLVLTPALRVEPFDREDNVRATQDPRRVEEEGAAGGSALKADHEGHPPERPVEKSSAAQIFSMPPATPQGGSVDEGAPWRDPNARLFDAVRGVSRSTAAENHTSSRIESANVAETPSMHARPAQVSTRPGTPDPEASDLGSKSAFLSNKVEAVVRRIAELETAQRDLREADGAIDLNEDDIDPVPAASTEGEAIEWEDHIAQPGTTASAPDGNGQTQSPPADPLDAAGLTEQAVADEALNGLKAQAESSSEDFLDEGSLRDLVADIVRQELQGALGERITRNVRKLVRREIQRSLAAEDLI